MNDPLVLEGLSLKPLDVVNDFQKAQRGDCTCQADADSMLSHCFGGECFHLGILSAILHDKVQLLCKAVVSLLETESIQILKLAFFPLPRTLNHFVPAQKNLTIMDSDTFNTRGNF